MRTLNLPLTLLVTALCAGTASAQIASIRFFAPVNPIAGLPQLLPGPLTGPLAGTPVTLPNLVPTMTPAISLAAAPLPAYAPAAFPAREGRLPASPAPGSRDGVVNPLRRVMPGVVIRFSDAVVPSKPGAAKPDASKEKLDHAFDGEGAPSKPVVRRDPISSGRHISLPEWDLERELGL